MVVKALDQSIAICVPSGLKFSLYMVHMILEWQVKNFHIFTSNMWPFKPNKAPPPPHPFNPWPFSTPHPPFQHVAFYPPPPVLRCGLLIFPDSPGIPIEVLSIERPTSGHTISELEGYHHGDDGQQEWEPHNLDRQSHLKPCQGNSQCSRRNYFYGFQSCINFVENILVFFFNWTSLSFIL